jgi:hypothetical protein
LLKKVGRRLEHRRLVLKKYFAIMLSVAIITLSVTFTTNAQSTPADVQKIRSKVQTLAVNRDKKIEVKLRDTTKVKGYITAVEQDSFSVSNSAGGTTSETIPYTDVLEVKNSGGGMSSKGWWILGGVAAGVVTTWLIVKPAVCDGGAQTRGIC